MFESNYNLMLCGLLSACLPDNNEDVGTRELLKAYVSLNKMSNGETINKASSIYMPFVGDEWKKICADFVSVDFYHFLKCVSFPFVKSPDKLVDILQAINMNIEQAVQMILYLHDLCNDNLKDSRYFETNYETLYSAYLEENRNSYKLSKDDFKDMFNAVNTVMLDFRTLSRSPSEKALDVAGMMSDEFLESKERQYEYAYRCYSERIKDVELASMYGTSIFSTKEARDKKVNKFFSAMKKTAGCLPIDLCKAIFLKRRNIKSTPKSASEYPNNVMLENSIFYNIVKSNQHPFEYESKTIFLFPSPFFIDKWLRDRENVDSDVIFVVNGEYEKHLLELSYSTEYKRGPTRGKYRFIKYQNIGDIFEDKPVACQLFVFAANTTEKNISTIYHLASGLDAATEIIVLSSDDVLEDFAERSRKTITDVIVFPQGISNTTKPKKKVVWKCTTKENDGDVCIWKSYLLPDKKRILILDKNTKSITQRDIEYPGAVRKVLSLSGKQNRKKPEKIWITPDIFFYFTSKSYDAGRVRVHAYIKNDNQNEKGKYSKEINKGSDMSPIVKTEEVDEWLNGYPFMAKKQRGTARENAQEISIRDVISEFARQDLHNCDVSIKTIWYMYPELNKIFSKNEYALFEEMASGPIGELYVEATPASKYDDAINEEYDESRRQLLDRVAILWRVLTFAKAKGHCESNVLDDLFSGKKKENRAFIWMRSAMTKKSFTEREYYISVTRAVERAVEDPDYVGVLMRLLYGIEGSAVCALTWEDYVSVPDFGFSSLLIRKQYDESQEDTVGFTNESKYRCIPCTDILEKVLSIVKRKKRCKQTDRIICCRPSELQKKCKALVDELEIKNVEVWIPTAQGSTVETDFSQYFGDFFRSNFRYWMNYYGMDGDEISYVLGNKRETTFGIHYCDYNNEKIQLKMRSKLARRDAMFAASENESVVKRLDIVNNSSLRLNAESKNPLVARIRISKGTDGTIMLESRNGMNIKIGVLSDSENEKNRRT